MGGREARAKQRWEKTEGEMSVRKTPERSGEGQSGNGGVEGQQAARAGVS